MNNNFKKFFRKNSNNGTNSNIPSTMQLMLLHINKKIRSPITGFMLVSLGVLLAASSGSWDITNHLLNKPETFSSPPHAGLYTGVAIVLLGSIMTLRYFRSNSNNTKHKDDNYNPIPLAVKLVTIGAIMLVAAGPFDYAWHLAFGLDGLLSPSHAVLTIGMVLSSIGALLGMLSLNNTPDIYRGSGLDSTAASSSSIVDSKNNKRHTISNILVVIGIVPVWITISGLTHMLSLPFSDTEYFKFNPDPILAAIIATLAFPFIVSFILCSSFGLTKRFGILSITGTIFIVVNLTTALLPNKYLVPTIPFYILNFIPILAMDALLSSLSAKTKIVNYIAGAVLGVTFFTLYYPLITHTYNEVLSNPQSVWPSLTSSIYFGMIGKIYPLIIIPAMTTGILGSIISTKLTQLRSRTKI